MSTKPGRLSRFWKELKRRNVLRSLAIYAGTAFIILEAAYQEFISQLEILGQSSFFVPVHMANRYSFLNQYDKAMDMPE